jgi:hypothetical protein
MAKWKKDKRTNNDPQNITHKTKDGVTRAPLKTHITLYYLFCLSSLCVLCTQCCQFYLDCWFVIAPSVFSGLSIRDCPFSFLWIVHSWLSLQFSLTFIYITDDSESSYSVIFFSLLTYPVSNNYWTITRVQLPHSEQELLTLSEYPSSLPVFW